MSSFLFVQRSQIQPRTTGRAGSQSARQRRARFERLAPPWTAFAPSDRDFVTPWTGSSARAMCTGWILCWCIIGLANGWPVTASHTLAAPSSDAVITRLPSGLNWAESTLPKCCNGHAIAASIERSQISAVPSTDAVCSVCRNGSDRHHHAVITNLEWKGDRRLFCARMVASGGST